MTPKLETSIPLLDDILGEWRTQLAADYTPYRNHVYRMINFCFALHDCDAEARNKVAIAGAFHDLGIWSDGTVDYLPPSVAQARRYLADNDFAEWGTEIELMIDMHHKLRAYRNDNYPLVEPFRKADLIDLSFGSVSFGVPRSFVGEVRQAFPNAGFHKRLGQLATGWFRQHPLSPPPFLKW